MANKKNKIKNKSVLKSKRRTGKENYKKRSKKQPRVSGVATLLEELQPVNFNTTVDDVTLHNTDKEPLAEYDGSLSQNSMNEDAESAEKEQLMVEVSKIAEFEPFSGRRVIDLPYFLAQLQDKAIHNGLFNCTANSFQLVGEKRVGLISKFKFECKVCREVVIINSENPESTEHVDVNIAATTGIVAAGIGYTQFQEFFSAMDIPVFSAKYYSQIQDQVYEKWEETAVKSMEAAAEREKEAAMTDGRMKNG